MANYDRILGEFRGSESLRQGYHVPQERAMEMKMKSKLSWADDVFLQESPEHFGTTLRVKKGNFEQQMILDLNIIEDERCESYINYITEKITEDFKRSIGEAVLKDEVKIDDGTRTPQTSSFREWAYDAYRSTMESIIPFRDKKKVKPDSILPSKLQPSTKTQNGAADEYYDADGKLLTKRSWWKLWT